MIPLQVVTRPWSGGFETAFVVGAERGVLRMPPPAGLRRLAPIDAAELVALHHVMGRLALYGQARLDIAEPVYVSRPDLPAWVAAAPGLGPEYVYVAFLRKRFAAAPLVPRTPQGLPGFDAPVRTLKQCVPYEDTLPVAGAGKVVVSEHALERVRTRFNVGSNSDAWRLLQRALRHESLREVELPAAEVVHKANKHGQPGRHFAVGSGLTAVIVDGHLRSVYWRKRDTAA